MKKIIDFCDFCEGGLEKEKCGVCNASLCDNCRCHFDFVVGGYNYSKINYFCKKCLKKIQFTNTKKGKEFIERIEKKIVMELNKKIEKIKVRKQK